MSNIEFIPGLIFKAPNANAPDYVKAKLSIKPAELIAYLQAQGTEWVNADVKEAKSGKWYAARDNWKPGDKAATKQEPERASSRNDFDDDFGFGS